MDENSLSYAGLGKREHAVYSALVELGPSTVGAVYRKSGLGSSKVYDTLAKLAAKGLVSFTVNSKTRIFSASPPSQLVTIAQSRLEGVKRAARELEKLSSSAREPQVAVVHEGSAAFSALFNRLAAELEHGDEYFALAFSDEYTDSSVPIILKKFHRKLAEKGVRDLAIAPMRLKASVKAVYADNRNIKIRFSKTNTPVGVSIVGGRVIQLLWGKRPTAIEISSRQVYERYRLFFLDAWRNSR